MLFYEDEGMTLLCAYETKPMVDLCMMFMAMGSWFQCAETGFSKSNHICLI